jgi:hypothetical protein
MLLHTIIIKLVKKKKRGADEDCTVLLEEYIPEELFTAEIILYFRLY